MTRPPTKPDPHAEMIIGLMRTYFEDIAPARRAGEIWAKLLTTSTPIDQISEMFALDMWEAWFLAYDPSPFGLAADLYAWIYRPPGLDSADKNIGEDVAGKAREFWAAQTGGRTPDPSPRFLYEFTAAACDAWDAIHAESVETKGER